MKISISTYSFLPLIKSGKMTQEEVIKKSKELGFDGIEIAEIGPENGESKTDWAKRLRACCEAQSLPIVNYTIAADFINGREGGAPEQEVERLCKEVDIAVLFGVAGMRHDASWGFNEKVARGRRGFDQVLPLLADGCRKVTEYAAEKHIRTMVENHGQFAQDSDRMEKLVTAVAHENFGILCDIGNFLCVDEDPVTAVSRVAPYTVHAHAKDFHFKSGVAPHPGRGYMQTRGGNFLRPGIIGHGDVPVRSCLRALRAAKYDGYITIEFEGIEEPVMAMAMGLENLRRYVTESC